MHSLKTGTVWPAVVLLLMLVMAAAGGLPVVTRTAPAAPSMEPAGGSSLWMSMARVTDDRQLLVVVDPIAKSAAVYHLDAAAGTLTLKSSRDIRWDLLVGEFNAQEPSPTALRKMLESASPMPQR